MHLMICLMTFQKKNEIQASNLDGNFKIQTFPVGETV